MSECTCTYKMVTVFPALGADGELLKSWSRNPNCPAHGQMSEKSGQLKKPRAKPTDELEELGFEVSKILSTFENLTADGDFVTTKQFEATRDKILNLITESQVAALREVRELVGKGRRCPVCELTDRETEKTMGSDFKVLASACSECGGSGYLKPDPTKVINDAIKELEK